VKNLKPQEFAFLALAGVIVILALCQGVHSIFWAHPEVIQVVVRPGP
jgi:hypothetical protein